MTSTTQTPAAGDLVTVTFNDGTTVRTWHGRLGPVAHVTVYDETARYGRPRFLKVVGSKPAEAPDVSTPWVQVTAETAYRFAPQGLAEDTKDWSLGAPNRIMFAQDLAGLTVAPVTEEGRAFIAKNESAYAKKNRLLATLRETNPELAAALDDVIDDLTYEARRDGEFDESQRHYSY